MAFVLGVDLQIQRVLGLEAVRQQITSAIGSGRGIEISTRINPRDVNTINDISKSAANAKTQLDTASRSATGFGQSIALAAKRYGAFVTATAVPLAVITTLRDATESIIEFDKEIIGLSQILQTTPSQIGDLRQQILDLAAATGTSREEISAIARTLAQAGIRGEQLTDTLSTLSRVPLVSVFEDLDATTNTLLATFNQFSQESLSAEDILSKLTAVSKEFAVSAEDLGAGIRRAGGAFSAVGGSFDELIAALTTIRSVTRESANVVGTSLRTITTRLARFRTIRFLEGFGIQVRDVRTRELLPFVEIIRNLEERFRTLDKETQNLVATQLGGFRQISRAFALLRAPDTLARSLELSRNATNEFTRDAELGLTSLEARLGQLRGEFERLVQTLAEPVFVPIIEAVTGLARGFIAIADALGPVLPLFIQLIGFTAGIKALNAALALIPVTLQRIAGINLAGLGGGLFGGPGETRADRVRRRVGGTFGGPGGVSAPQAAALTTTFRSLTDAGKKLVASQVGQLAIVGGLTAGFKALEERSIAVGSDFGQMSFSVLKTISALTLFASILSGRSITQIVGALGGLGSAIAALTGAFAVGLVITGAIDANRALDELEQRINQEISEIDVDFATPDVTLETSAGEFIGRIIKTIQDAGNELDPGTLSGAVRSLGDRVGEILTGKFSEAFERASITDSDIEGIIDSALRENRDIFRAILAEGIVEFGQDFEEGIVRSAADLVERITGVAIPEEAARVIVDRLLENASAIDFASAQEIASRRRLERAQQAAIEAQQRIADDLASIQIPQGISSDLQAFGESVSATVNIIQDTISDFDALRSAIGNIAGPELPTDFDTSAIVNALIQGGVDVFADIPGIERLNQLGQDFFSVANLVQRFVDNITNTNIVDRLQSLEGDSLEAANIIDDALDLFVEGLQQTEGITPEIEANVRLAGREVIQATLQAFQRGEAFNVNREDVIEAVKRSEIGAIGGAAAEEFVQQLEEALEITTAGLQTRLEAQALIDEMSFERARAIEQTGDFFVQTLEKLGLALTSTTDISRLTQEQLNRIPPAFQFLFDTAQNGDAVINQVATSLEAANVVLREFEEASQAEADAFRDFTSAQRTSAENTGELSDAFQSANERARNARLALKAFEEILSEASQQSVELSESEIERLQAIRETVAGQERLIQATIAAQEALILQPEEIFRDSVNSFVTGVDRFIQNLTGAADGGTANVQQAQAAQGEVNIDNALVTVQAADQEIRLSNEAISEEVSNILERAGFGVTIEELNTLIQQAISDQVSASENLRDRLSAIEDIDPGAVEELVQRSASNINEITNRVIELVRQAGERALGSAFTLGEEQTRLAQDNIRKAVESAILESVTFELQLSEEARRLLESGVTTEGGGFAQISGLFVETLEPAALQIETGGQSVLEGGIAIQEAAGQLTGIVESVRELRSQEEATAANENLVRQFEEIRETIQRGNDQFLDSVLGKFDEQIEATERAQEDQDLNIEGLNENNEVTQENTDRLNQNNEAIRELESSLRDTGNKFDQGVDLSVDAVQTLNLDVRGLNGVVEELRPQFEAVADLAAKRVISEALRQIAARAGDAESAAQFSDVANGLT